MNFHQRNNDFERRSGQKKFIFGSFCVVFCLIIFSFQGPRSVLFAIAEPFWNVKNSVISFLSDSIELLQSKSALITQNNLLREEIENNNENQLLDKDLKNENDDLKTILNRKSSSQKEILAAILEKPFLSPYDTLIIDVGSADGISAGNQVLADGNIFIGSISEVYAHTSKVILYSSSGESINVLVGTSSIEKQASGMGGGNFSLQMPIGSAVSIGDPIVVPSLSANIFSTVGAVESKPADSFETVLFKNPVNIAELRWVEVVLSSNKK